MQRLRALSLKDSVGITRLRRAVGKSPAESSKLLKLGLALGDAGCTHEATVILRPLKKSWKTESWAARAIEYLQVQSWWNKNNRDFILQSRAGKHDEALALLGDRIPHFWDQPGLLMHLGGIASDRDELELSNHIYRRVQYLAGRGLPKINMTAFEYVAGAALVDNLLLAGQADQALSEHERLRANPGNAMSHEIRKAALTTAAGRHDEAMQVIAVILVTADKHRRGYSKTFRKDFVEKSSELEVLRARDDWAEMIADPLLYRKRTETRVRPSKPSRM